jgi:hypothetical protein
MLVFQLPRPNDTDPVLILRVDPDPGDPTRCGYDVLDTDGRVLLGGVGRPADKNTLTTKHAALILAGHLATEGVRIAGDPEYPSYRSEEGRAVLAANHHRFRMLTLNDMLPPPPAALWPGDDPLVRRLLTSVIQDRIRDGGLPAADRWIGALIATGPTTAGTTAGEPRDREPEGGTDEPVLPSSPQEGFTQLPGGEERQQPPHAPRSPKNPTVGDIVEALASAVGSAFDVAARERRREYLRQVLIPELAGWEPEAISVGEAGVFACESLWSFSDQFPHIGYLGTLSGFWNAAAVFTCTRPVAEAIVADEQAKRAAVQAALQAAGAPDAAAGRQVNDAMPNLSFDADTIVIDERALTGDPDSVVRIAPDANSRYEVGWSWGWHLVRPSSCHRVVGDLPPTSPQ